MKRTGRNIFRKTRGVSLIEIMMALVIILFMSTALAGMFIYSSQLSQKESIMSEAAYLAALHLNSITENVKTKDDFETLKSSVQFFPAYIPTKEEEEFVRNNDGDTKMQIDELGRYIYNVEVRTVSQGIKYVGVLVHLKKEGSDPLQPDLSLKNSGQLIKMGTYVLKP